MQIKFVAFKLIVFLSNIFIHTIMYISWLIYMPCSFKVNEKQGKDDSCKSACNVSSSVNEIVLCSFICFSFVHNSAHFSNNSIDYKLPWRVRLRGVGLTYPKISTSITRFHDHPIFSMTDTPNKPKTLPEAPKEYTLLKMRHENVETYAGRII